MPVIQYTVGVFLLLVQTMMLVCICILWASWSMAVMRKTSNANSCHECNNLTHPLTDIWNSKDPVRYIWMTSLQQA